MNAFIQSPETLSMRDRILDAAESVAAMGAAHLTLDAVAHEAGVSKGGLLHHFRSKEGLLAAMLRRHCDRSEAEIDAGVKKHGETLEGHLLARMDSRLNFARRHGKVGAALLGALASDPALMTRPRKDDAAHVAAMSELPGDLDLALVTLFAINGLMLSEMLGLNCIDESRRACVTTKLRELAAQCSQAPRTRRP